MVPCHSMNAGSVMGLLKPYHIENCLNFALMVGGDTKLKNKYWNSSSCRSFFYMHQITGQSRNSNPGNLLNKKSYLILET